MKQLFIYHNELQYEFRLLEQSNVIQVIKADVLTYEMKVGRQPFFICNCPGSVFRGKCWHLGYVKDLLSMPSINEPWTQWAEEALI